ncbi:MAG: hypothetical protein MJZ74_02540 [Muribaculaceae bacterium]|nr:hypothetical protein [Muribaculaceae bacterium]
MIENLKNIGLRFDRSFTKGFVKQLCWLLSFVVIVYVLLMAVSFIPGFYSGDDNGVRMRDVLCALVGLNGGNLMSLTFTFICSLAKTVVFSGMLISIFTNILNRRIARYTNGDTNYSVSNHVVILGFNKSLPSLLKVVNAKYPHSYILLLSSRKTADVRSLIKTNVSDEVEKRVVVMCGAINSEEKIERLHLNKNVKEIFLLGEDDQTEHDAINMQCVELIDSAMKGCESTVECHVQINSHTMFSVLQSVDYQRMLHSNVKFLPFNFNEIWAQKVLATFPVRDEAGDGFEYMSLDGDGITATSKKHVHLIVISLNEMGKAIATNAAHVLHFPNYVTGDFSTCSHITFIDRNAVELGKEFRNCYRSLFDLARWRSVDASECNDRETGWIDPIADADADSPYKHLGPINFMDIQWEFVKGNANDSSIHAYLESCALDDSEITTIVLCGDDSKRNSTLCMGLPETIREAAHQILVRQNDTPITVKLLSNVPGYKNIRAFGRMTECYRENLISDKYGKLVNACYGEYVNGERHEVDINDHLKVQELWNKCGILDRWSSIYSANMLFYKLRSFGLRDVNNITKEDINKVISSMRVQDLTRMEHNRWNTEKLLLGFRPLYAGAETEMWDNGHKAQMKKEKKHKLIMPFEMLPQSEQDKDDDVNTKLFDIYRLTPLGQ